MKWHRWLAVAGAFLLATVVMAGPSYAQAPQPAAPSARIGGPPYAAVGQYVTLDGSGSTGAGLRYRWDFGDRTYSMDGASVSKAYAYPGTYTVILEVVDGYGRSATATHVIVVGGVGGVYVDRDAYGYSGYGYAVGSYGYPYTYGYGYAVGSYYNGGYYNGVYYNDCVYRYGAGCINYSIFAPNQQSVTYVAGSGNRSDIGAGCYQATFGIVCPSAASRPVAVGSYYYPGYNAGYWGYPSRTCNWTWNGRCW